MSFGRGWAFYGLLTVTALIRAQTLLFAFLVVEVVRIQVIRSRYDLSNRWLIGAIGITLLLQLLVFYTPPTSSSRFGRSRRRSGPGSV